MDKKKTKPKVKPKVKPKPKVVPKVVSKVVPKVVSKVVSKVVPKVKGITVEYAKETTNVDENKYSDKIKSLVIKIKNQNIDIDRGIRFCWKN